MNDELDVLRTLYQTTKQILITRPLTDTEIATYHEQYSLLTPLGQTKQETALITAYQALIMDNLSFPTHGLFYLMNINTDHTTISLPVSPQQVHDWSVNDRHLLRLFEEKAFLYQGLPVDDTAAMALL
ncbi:hypothetical protein [Secundilactobacillus paracollinoides]|uniref:Uncharacterized protein n=1 Tax=Secundilactobacillus paracollinoides TaxID=240427 RepID=A0A1B2IXQ9_9LACO|nr:hypothetical protein [Secundilactobacillus paracollinoides]ANZ61007.1 hypothetical protein AYR61_06390 [Secundilactobacillus paracollinoides]ANZ66864.1 hypothetical protein AYR63_06750 [Secundilactobacillus paracollinoides]